MGSISPEIKDFIQNQAKNRYHVDEILPVKVETKPEKYDPKILVLLEPGAGCKFLLYPYKTNPKVELRLNYLSIQSIDTPSPTQMKIQYNENKTLSLSPAESTSTVIDRLLLNVHISLRHIFPNVPLERLMSISIGPRERKTSVWNSVDSVAVATDQPCGGFSNMYACMCDLHGYRVMDEIVWDMNTIYDTQDSHVLYLHDFDHLSASDHVVPLLATLQHNSWFTGIDASKMKLVGKSVYDMFTCPESIIPALVRWKILVCVAKPSPDAQRELLNVLRKNTSIEVWNLANTGINKEFAQKLMSSLLANPQSKCACLDLSENVIEDKGLSYIGQAIPSMVHGLQSFNVSASGLNAKSINRLMDGLTQNSMAPNTLHTLNLSQNSLKNDDLLNLGAFLAQPNVLQNLDLSETDAQIDLLQTFEINCSCVVTSSSVLSVAADQERLTIFYGLTTSYCILRIELEVTVAVVTKMKFRDLSGCSANRHLPTDCGATNITYFQGALLVSCEALGRVYRIGVTPSTPPYVSSLARYTNATIHGEFYPMIKGANGSANSKTGCLFAYQNFHWVNHDSHGGNFDEAKLRTNTLGPAYLDSRIVRGGISFTDVRADVRGSVWSRAIPQELNLGTSSIALTPFGPEIEGVIEQYLVRLEDFRHLVPREYLELYADGFFNFNVNDYLYIHSVTHSTFFRLDLDLSNFAKIKIIPLFDGKFMFVDKTARSKIYLLELKYLIPRLESWRLTPVEVSLRMSLPIEPIYTASIECENCSPRKSHTLKPAHGLTFRFEVTNGAQRDYGGRYCWYLKTEEGLRTRLLNEVFPSVSHSTMTRQFGNSSNVTLVLKYRTWNLLGRDTITAERKLLWPPYGTTTIPTTITPIPPLDVRNRDLRLAVLLAAVLTLALVLLLGCLVCQRGRKQRKKVALARMQREKEQQARGESIQQLMSMGAHQSSGALLMRPSQTMMMRAGPTAMNPAFVPLISLGSLAMMPKPQEEEVADTADEQMQNMLQMMEVNYGVMPQEREESRPVAKKQNYDDDDEEFVEEEVHKRGAMPREAYLLKGPSTGQPRMDESPESTPMRSSSTRKKPTTRKKAEKSSKAPKGRKVRDSVAESLVSEEDDDIVIPSGWSTAMAQGRAPAGTKGARVIY